MSYYQHLAVFFAIISAVFLLLGCCNFAGRVMQPRSYTVLSAVGSHVTVILYPQPFGKGIDREGNTYRILGDTAHLIED